MRFIRQILLVLFWIVLAQGLQDEGFKYGYPPKNTIVRDYIFNLTHTYHAQDGVFKSGYLINEQSPGPLIQGEEGDWIRLTVNNHLPVSVTIHFHGILQKGTPWSDGVPGVTQYPILSGDSFTYHFQLKDQFGPSWYHAHFRGYSTDGIYGPMYIIPKGERDRPYRLITNDNDEIELINKLEKSPINIIAHDSLKLTMDDLVVKMFTFGIEPLCIQSILLNGKGRVYCHSSEVISRPFVDRFSNNLDSTAPFIDTMGCFQNLNENGYKDIEINHFALESPGFSRPCEESKSEVFTLFTENLKWQYINIINAGGQVTKSFSIDDHDFYIIAIDGVFIQPRKAQQVNIPVGSRFTILLPTDSNQHGNTTAPFKMRFAAIMTPQFIEGLGLLYYGEKSDYSEKQLENYSDTLPSNGRRIQDLQGKLLNDRHITIWPRETHPFEKSSQLLHKGKADHTFKLYLNRTSMIKYSMFEDGTTLPRGLELAKPLLHQLDNSGIIGIDGSLTDNIKQGDVIDLIIDNYRKFSHPTHLHGHLFHLISYSVDEIFPYDTVEDAINNNYTELLVDDNPPLFDISFTSAKGHSVVRFVADNPGIWLIHCHNIVHLIGGMGAILFEAIEDIPEIPKYLLNQIHIDYQNDIGISELRNNTHDGSLHD